MLFLLVAVSTALRAPPPISDKRWKVVGDGFRDGEDVVLTPDAPHKSGLLFFADRLIASSFRLTMTYTITSENNRVFGDGLGLFVTNTHPSQGPALGFSDHWRGAAVLIDTYRNGPSVPTLQLVFNDGNDVYNPKTDGAELRSKGCFLSTARGSQHYVELSYEDRQFALSLDGQRCAVLSATLEPGYFISVASLTGDTHELHRVHSLVFSEQRPTTRHSVESNFAKNLKLSPIELAFTAQELPPDPRAKLVQIYTACRLVDESTATTQALAQKRAALLGEILRDFAAIPAQGVSRSTVSDFLAATAAYYATVYDAADASLAATRELIQRVKDATQEGGDLIEVGGLRLMDVVLLLNGVVLCAVFAAALRRTRKTW